MTTRRCDHDSTTTLCDNEVICDMCEEVVGNTYTVHIPKDARTGTFAREMPPKGEIQVKPAREGA